MRMLICPKHIYNLCLLHACFVSLCHVFLELSYTFDHIWTNLLTQCTQLPVPVFCCFCISGSRPLKVLQKFWKKYIENQRPGSLRKHQGRRGGPPQGLQKGPWHGPTLGRPRHPPGCLVSPLGAPFDLYLVPTEETPNIDLLLPFSSLYCRHRRFKIEAA